MEKIYDIYDQTNWRLVKADVKLGPRSGSHKDLKKGRYLKERVGSEPDLIDHDGMAAVIHMLNDQVLGLQTQINELIESKDDDDDRFDVSEIQGLTK